MSCSIVSAKRVVSPRRTLRTRYGRFLRLLTICTRRILSTAVGGSNDDDQAVSDNTLDLKPENLLYLAKKEDSSLVLADFGIAKHLDSPEGMLKTMAGSFGYAAPEVMLKRGHGKPVDMWSMGVITYTLLCGYSPFRSENLADLIDETRHGRVIFHERYWKDVSKEAKDFIMTLLQPDPEERATSGVSKY